MNSLRRVCVFALLWLTLSAPSHAGNVAFPAFSYEAGYLATLLVNEVACPGERGYVSEANS